MPGPAGGLGRHLKNCGYEKEASMNRGQNRGIAGLTLTRLALCLCVCLAILTGTASATSTGAQPPAAQPGRSWENYFGVAILPKGRAVVVGDKGLVMVTDNQGQ